MTTFLLKNKIGVVKKIYTFDFLLNWNFLLLNQVSKHSMS